MRFIIFLLTASLSLTIQAVDSDGNYAVWGPGQRSCHNYTKSREAGDYDDYKHFVMGYFTAYNTLTNETFRISGDKNINDVLTWLDDYCEPKGIHGFEQAVANFIVEHHETRLTRPPSQFQR